MFEELLEPQNTILMTFFINVRTRKVYNQRKIDNKDVETVIIPFTSTCYSNIIELKNTDARWK